MCEARHTPGSGRSMPRTTGQEALAAWSTATSSAKIVSCGSPVHIQGTLPSPQPQALLLSVLLQPQHGGGQQLIHPEAHRLIYKADSSYLKEYGATGGFQVPLRGGNKGRLSGAPQMSLCHDCPLTLEAALGSPTVV